MKTTKKILSLVLAIIMIGSAVPIAMAEGEAYKVGDIIQFGSYPQSQVTDKAIISALNAVVPEWDDWTSYGYYSGSGYYGTMQQGDWMKYIDIVYGGSKYRGVKFTQYRPYNTFDYSTVSDTYQDDNGYNINTVYWFKFDPIDWRILDPTTGFVMCETIIDSQPFSNTIYKRGVGTTYEYFNDSSYKNYASDYETSFVRGWLNDVFYNTAFTNSEKKEINMTILNNDGYNTLNGNLGYEVLDSNETEDEIFLLSYDEVRNSNFGFESYSWYWDSARATQGSDYAQNQGLYVYRSSDGADDNKARWFLRSPGKTSEGCCYVSDNGVSSAHDYDLCNTSYGIRPALCLKDIYNYNHTHTYTSIITIPATHTKEGVETYTCDCGDSYTKPVEKLEGHTYTSKVVKEPTHLVKGEKIFTCECGHSYKEEIAKIAEHSYSAVITAPTCKNQGYTTYTCECGHSYIGDYVAVLPHNYTSVITKKPTHVMVGVKTYTCTLCGDVYTEDIAKTPEHTYSVSKVIEPTCTEKGYTIYTCVCGDSYTGNYISEKGHNYDGEICESCGKKCTHMCHKSGIMGFIWKIVRFFCKFFKCKPICSCGVAHY